MDILLSTNMYDIGELNKVLPIVEAMEGKVGIEVFPLFHLKGYEEELKNCLPVLKTLPVSFHGPYYDAEHSAIKGSDEYNRTMSYMKKTLEYAQHLSCKYMVYHHNNCQVLESRKMEMLDVANKNFREIEEMYAKANIPVFVENAGVINRGNMILNQEEFIALCIKEQYRVLIDIGHAHANGWNLSETIESLKDQIEAYHIHNNDGIHDSHNRILEGSLDFEQFVLDYKKFTPDADIVVEYSRASSNDDEGIQEDLSYILKKF